MAPCKFSYSLTCSLIYLADVFIQSGLKWIMQQQLEGKHLLKDAYKSVAEIESRIYLNFRALN